MDDAHKSYHTEAAQGEGCLPPSCDASAGRLGTTVAAAGTGPWPPTQCLSENSLSLSLSYTHTAHTCTQMHSCAEFTQGVHVHTQLTQGAHMCTSKAHGIYECVHAHKELTLVCMCTRTQNTPHVCTCVHIHSLHRGHSLNQESLGMLASQLSVPKSPPEPLLSILLCPLHLL